MFANLDGLRLLETCRLVPVDRFVHLVGLGWDTSAYQQLARLRHAGLAEVRPVDLGYLLGERRLALWQITDQGRQILRASCVAVTAKRPGAEALAITSGHDLVQSRCAGRSTDVSLLVATYRLLAWLVDDQAAAGRPADVRTWEWPWTREVWVARQPDGYGCYVRDADARRTLGNQEDMRHPPSIWTEPDNADYPLSELLDAYRLHLANRAKPVAAGTITASMRRLATFIGSLRLHQEELVLGSVTPFNVEGWIADMRAGLLAGCLACGARAGAACTDGRGQPCERHPQRKRYTEETVASVVLVIKSFTHKYIQRALDMTRRDLLERVERFQPPLRVEDGSSQGELDQLLNVNEGSDKYTDVRDRALVAFYAASGPRFSEVIRLTENQVDRYSERVRTVGKGDKGREVKIGERALVQDQMGWSSDQMVRRYAGYVRGKLAAELMPQFAPI